MQELVYIGQKAKEASKIVGKLTSAEKNKIINDAANELLNNSDDIIEENKKDLEAAKSSGISGALLDRLTLTKDRIDSMVLGLRQIASLQDPIGEVISMKTLPNGLIVGQKRVPLGVIGIIYEARPNVTADAFGLCFKAGSSVILRGGKEAISSNIAIVKAFEKALLANNLPKYTLQIIKDTSRETAVEFMKLNKFVDLLIPRGGAGLIQSVVKNSTIPVIETGVGNCHIFVDETADIEKAINIIINAKTQRPGVCNACEKLIIHRKIADIFLPLIIKELLGKNVEVRGDYKSKEIVQNIILADEEDWNKEYLDYIIAIKIAEDFDEAIEHIQTYSTGHSEAIITENYSNSQKFLEVIDSACVYVNASTRFTDGFEFGFGAEIGISTQKIHARGPMGLKELTSVKYIIYGNGQTRN